MSDLATRLSRQTVRIGSSSACEICLTGSGVAPVHAEVVHQGSGQLVFVASAAGASSIEDRPLSPGVGVPFDFRTQFQVGTQTVPLTHPDLCLMVMSPGHLPAHPTQLTMGRDPERNHLVLTSPGVSGVHATLHFEQELRLTDHASTSGSWLEGKRIENEEGVVVTSGQVVFVGPLPVPIDLAVQLHALFAEPRTPRGTFATQSVPHTTEFRRRPSRLPSMGARHRTVLGTLKMSQASTSSIGRTPDNDVVLDYAQVSSRHARLTVIGSDVFLEDLGSELGTTVRGTRLKPGQKARVMDGQRVLFGPLPALIVVEPDRVDVIVEDHEGWAGRPLFEVTASHVSVVVPHRDDSSKTKTLLDNVNFKVLPGDLVALMGPSGSGKTTLLHALSGYIKPARGQILVNGSPLSDVFESLRGSIGYVPQDDIIHPELTVFEAVRYSARFRLPSDYSEDEIDRRVLSTLSQLGLDSVAHLRVGKPEAKVLSGGQRKRVNLAIELVTDPVLLFLDEPTSGLAADDTTSLVDLLARLASDHGKTIIATIHQPARDEYEKFNLALVLGHGGIPLYFGPSVEGYSFFEAWRGPTQTRGISTPRDMFAELSEREARIRVEMPAATRQQVREGVSEAYRKEYERSDVHSTMTVETRRDTLRIPPSSRLQRRERPRGQLRYLLGRYLKVKSRDRVGTAILMMQAPLIGLLLSLVFGGQQPAVPYWCLGAINQLAGRGGAVADSGKSLLNDLLPVIDHAGALFFLVVAAVWFGTSNAAREVVSERAIFRREKMVNLGTFNYVVSKFVVLCALCVVQCTLLLLIVFFSLGLSGGLLAFSTSLSIMMLTAFCSVALGLLLSASVSSSEAAMALTPIALIPQVVLGGIMVPVTTNEWLRIPMMLVPSRWGFEGVVRAEREAVAGQPGFRISVGDVADSPPDFLADGHFECALAQMQSEQLIGAWGFSGPAWVPAVTLAAMTVVLLALVSSVLAKKR